MTRAAAEQSWEIRWDDAANALVTTPADGPPGGPASLRARDGSWIPVERVRSVQPWIEGSESGVRVHLDDESAREVLFYDSGNVDFTATWNEYLYDGAWAFGAGLQLAEWLGVAYTDEWS